MNCPNCGADIGTPTAKKYHTDPVFRSLVHVMIDLLRVRNASADEVKEATTFAAEYIKEHNIPPMHIK